MAPETAPIIAPILNPSVEFTNPSLNAFSVFPVFIYSTPYEITPSIAALDNAIVVAVFADIINIAEMAVPVDKIEIVAHPRIIPVPIQTLDNILL